MKKRFDWNALDVYKFLKYLMVLKYKVNLTHHEGAGGVRIIHLN